MTEEATETTEAPVDTGAEVIEHPAGRELVKGTLAVQPHQTFWTVEQQAALRTLGLEDVPNADLAAFLHLVQRSGLDPFAREVYLIGRWDKDAPNNTRYTVQTGIDGFRHIAERTGEYDGREGPWWCGPDGVWKDIWLADEPPVAAKVKVYRVGMRMPVDAVAHYREFVPTYRDRRTQEDKVTPMWAKMPAHMLAKCAEALAIRQAFPRQTSGIYSDDEMGRADVDAKAAHKAEQEAERAAKRRALVREQAPEGPGDPASPKDTAPGDVVVGEVVDTIDRDAVWAELQSQADTLGKSVRQHTTRWVAAHKKNIEEATDDELEAFVASHRARVAEKRAQIVADAVDDVAETTIIPEDPTDTGDELEPTGDGPTPVDPVDGEATQPHRYQDWGGVCIVCGDPVGADLHTT